MVQKHLEMARRRAAKGQYSTTPISALASSPATSNCWRVSRRHRTQSLMGERDLGWMALDLDYAAGKEPRFFRARMVDGVIEVPALAR